MRYWWTMSKIHLNRLKDRTGYTGEKYKTLMEQIIANNFERIHNSVNAIRNTKIEAVSKKISTKEKRFNIPETTELVKPRSVWSRKAAERGELLTDALRSRLDNDIKAILSDKSMFRTRGKLTGTLKDQAIREMGKRVKETFLNYTKADESGVPKNIKTIASVEIRSIVNQANDEYMDKLVRKNDDIVVIKKWIHNGNVWKSKTYKARTPHKNLHGVTVNYNDNFVIKSDTGIYSVPYPHHVSLPIGEIAGCNCSVQYLVRKLKKSEKIQ